MNIYEQSGYTLCLAINYSGTGSMGCEIGHPLVDPKMYISRWLHYVSSYYSGGQTEVTIR